MYPYFGCFYPLLLPAFVLIDCFGGVCVIQYYLHYWINDGYTSFMFLVVALECTNNAYICSLPSDNVCNLLGTDVPILFSWVLYCTTAIWDVQVEGGHVGQTENNWQFTRFKFNHIKNKWSKHIT